MGHRGRDVPRGAGGGFLHDLGPFRQIALIGGGAVLAGFLLSGVVIASHQFAYVIQQIMSGWGK